MQIFSSWPTREEDKYQTSFQHSTGFQEKISATEGMTGLDLSWQVRGAECVVMAGDPKQLPPTLQSQGALDAQLDRTLFDRLQDSGVRPPWVPSTRA